MKTVEITIYVSVEVPDNTDIDSITVEIDPDQLEIYHSPDGIETRIRNIKVIGYGTLSSEEAETIMVVCKFCKNQCDIISAHRHQGEWVGECCWDDRLKITE